MSEEKTSNWNRKNVINELFFVIILKINAIFMSTSALKQNKDGWKYTFWQIVVGKKWQCLASSATIILQFIIACNDAMMLSWNIFIPTMFEIVSTSLTMIVFNIFLLWAFRIFLKIHTMDDLVIYLRYCSLFYPTFSCLHGFERIFPTAKRSYKLKLPKDAKLGNIN